MLKGAEKTWAYTRAHPEEVRNDLRALRGCTKGSPAWGGLDGVSYQRNIRDDKLVEQELEKEAAAKTAKRVAEGRRPFEGLRGSLQNSGVFSGDPVEIIRKMRDEW
jgi:hypothetical protein